MTRNILDEQPVVFYTRAIVRVRDAKMGTRTFYALKPSSYVISILLQLDDVAEL